MNKFVNPIPNGGAPFHNNRIQTELQADFWGAIESILNVHANLVEGIIVAGCTMTSNVGTPANFDMTAGIVYLNGEFQRIAAATNQTFPKYIAAKTVSYIAKTFADAASKNLIEVKEAELLSSPPGAGQSIILNNLNAGVRKNIKAYFGFVDRNGTTEVFGGVLKKKVIRIPNWNMDTTGSINISHGLPFGSSIRSVFVTILDDSGNSTNLEIANAGTLQGWITFDNTNIVLTRLTSGSFDNTNYDSVAGFNRGFITIEYDENYPPS